MSLGWNFLQFAFNPPVGNGVVYGWLICGIVFELMGIPPLWFMFKTVGLAPQSTRVRTLLAPPGTKAMATALRAVADLRKAATAASSTKGDMVSELERLDALHKSGGLSDDEYDKAKRRLLA
jgi:hypothetical protein